MAHGQHRTTRAERSLAVLATLVPRPAAAAGVGAVLLAVTSLVVVVAREGGDATAARGAAVVPLAAPSSSPASAAALAAAVRAEERTSRDRPRTLPTVTPTPTATTTSPKPAPVKPPKVVATMRVVSTVNVRTGPSADANRVATLAARTAIGVTGARRSGWTQVVTGTRAGWVRSTFLAATKPTATPSTTTRTTRARTASGVSSAPCPKSRSIEPHLSSNARAVYRAVCAAYGGSVSSFGGYRPGDDGDHGSGRAVDIMVSGDPGWTIARYVQAHARELGVTYVIYQQKIWLVGKPTGAWRPMEDRGSRTANHYDHVHVSVA